MTFSSFVKSISFARRQVRYIRPLVGLIGGEGGCSSQCLKAICVFQ